ncbi:cytochrome oxidase assembly protein ShyY1 [Sphaerotilus hippei]|uniref:SURF1-like protein n=1 Tax=Sphaerotilus hippei TaxID=744406 RepID=A0A318GZK0_9BURK|nr:SURF1 family protein [Sphaerotilus hippei]PXW95768.1 cytochrome oxidase assembly protein ShyY1 [Sphaerotilus hippei]
MSSPTEPARRHRHRLLPLLGAVLMVALTARLGWWQLDRAEQKRQLQAQRTSRSALPPLTASELASAPDAALGQRDRRIHLQGRWIESATVYLDNRTMEGRTGFLVVTPLQLADQDRAVAVLRGWLPRDRLDPARLPPLVPEPGLVTLQGLLVPPPSVLLDLAGGASAATPSGATPERQPSAIRQNLDLPSYARALGRPLYPVMVQQEDAAASAPAPLSTGTALFPALRRQWPRPAARIETHLGYAAQWFGLSLLTAGLYVWFQLVRPRQRRARPAE